MTPDASPARPSRLPEVQRTVRSLQSLSVQISQLADQLDRSGHSPKPGQSDRAAEVLAAAKQELAREDGLLAPGVLDRLRGELQSAKATAEQAGLAARLERRELEQELRRADWAHKMASERMAKEHEEEIERLEWRQQQAIKMLLPDQRKLQSELEHATGRLLDLKDANRQLSQQLEASSKQLELARLSLDQQLRDQSPDSTARCNVCYDRSVSRVFGCGHAKCAECANRLIGLGRGCPDCRAPLDEPRMVFLNVG